MELEWNDSQPIYRQLRGRVVAMILDGLLQEGEPLPSVRTVAAENRVNPLTVLKSYQELVDQGIVESRRGRGMFITAGAATSFSRPSARSSSWKNGRTSRPPSIASASPATDLLTAAPNSNHHKEG